MSLLRLLVKNALRASLMAQRLRICLPMQETRVRSLVWEDPTCCRATKPVPQPSSLCSKVQELQEKPPHTTTRKNPTQQ